MKKHIMFFVAFIVLLACLLTGCSDKGSPMQSESSTPDTTCQESTTKDLPDGLYIEVANMPFIGEFSASSYENRKDQYAPIASVSYIAQGIKAELPIDDGRVFQLMNLLSRSFDEGNYGMQFGYVELDGIAQWYKNPEPMLEITFVCSDDISQASGLALCSKMLIRGGTVLEILDERLFEDHSEKGVLLWPYNLLLEERAGKYMCYPEKEHWIDFLVYAGFSNS